MLDIPAANSWTIAIPVGASAGWVGGEAAAGGNCNSGGLFYWAQAVKTRPYQPSNGTAGMCFDDAWCSNCQRDLAYRIEDAAVWARGNCAPPPDTPAKPCTFSAVR